MKFNLQQKNILNRLFNPFAEFLMILAMLKLQIIEKTFEFLDNEAMKTAVLVCKTSNKFY